jgi:ferritin-like metal-binding protein YciE
MRLRSLYGLLVTELQEIYDAEKQVTEGLSNMIKAAHAPDLVEGFADHLEQTQGQIARLEEIAQELEIDLSGQKSPGMAGILKEAELALQMERSLLRDLVLISVAKRVEHYEMARYENARTLAEAMEEDYVADLLQETLDEEELSEQILTEAVDTIMNDINDQEDELNVLANS